MHLSEFPETAVVFRDTTKEAIPTGNPCQ